MADEPTTDAAREELLAVLDPMREEIEANLAERDRLYESRAAAFLTIREAAPDVPLSKLAARAGISVPAVIQQIDKAKARRAEAAAPAEAASG